MKRLAAAVLAFCLCALCAQGKDLRYNWKSLESLEKAAREDKLSAQADLGRYYILSGQYEEALPWLQKAAKKGNAEAIYLTGFCYQSGRCGQEADLRKAIKYYKKAARKNHYAALYKMAQLLYEGQGVKQNKTKAAVYMKRAADKGSLDAWRFLAEAHYTGKTDGFKQDYKKAKKYWEKLAAEEDVQAFYRLAGLYHDGQGVPKDLNQAFEWNLYAAQAGLAAAQYRVGLAYLRGEGVEQDSAAGFKWLQNAADQGYEKALDELNGIEFYVYEGPELPMEGLGNIINRGELERQARSGHAASQYIYGTLCADVIQKKGESCDPLEWYQKAAAQGYAPALTRVAIAYHDGTGVPKDERKAAQYFLQAAEKGYVTAQLVMGLNYERGECGLPENLEKAEMWYKRAAQEDNPLAKTMLGNFYVRHAKGDAQGTQGLNLLEEAAEEGHPRAQYLYGLYLTRLHPEGSPCWKKGAGWLQKAVQKGNKDAEEYILKENISLKNDNTANKDVKCAAVK